MSDWPRKPLIYEINSFVWLRTLSAQYERDVTLATVPDAVIDEIASYRIDIVWLMGVWQRSEAARISALNYTHEYQPVLPDLTEADVSGSAYSIGNYEVDARFGGREGLAQLREQFLEHDILLILDYVPNHVATDHPWITEKPHYLVQGTPKDLEATPDRFFKMANAKGQNRIIAHGRDPHFPGWIDTAQLNTFSPEVRKAVTDILLDIASQCDGVRCDMAMLVVNDIFDNTWGSYLSLSAPPIEFWEETIPAVKAQYPNFVFIAEVYWDMEYTLLQQGFDFTYDKRLYDRIQHNEIMHLHEHLQAAVSYQEHQVRFIENHDEDRAISSLGIEQSRAAATLVASLPGATLLHDGQFIGRRKKLPMQISRQPDETPNLALYNFYHRLMTEVSRPIYKHGSWRLFEIAAAFEDSTHHNLLAYGWTFNDQFRLIVVNLSSAWSQGTVRAYGWDELHHHNWRLYDVLHDTYRQCDGKQMASNGLQVELAPYQPMIFRFDRIGTETHAEYTQHINDTTAY